MEQPKLRVIQFTVSSSKKIHRARDEDSSFCSMGFELPESVSPAEAMALQLEAYEHVYRANILNLLANGSMNTESASTLLADFKTRQTGILESLRKKIL